MIERNSLLKNVFYNKVTIIPFSLAIILQLTYLRLGIDSHKCQVVPHFLQKAVVVPLVVGGDGYSVGDLADYVELLNADLIDLIEDVDARDVGPVSLHNVDKFIGSCITPRNNT